MGDSSSTRPPLYGKGQAWAVPLTIESPVQAGGGGMLGVDRGRGPLIPSQSLCTPSWAAPAYPLDGVGSGCVPRLTCPSPDMSLCCLQAAVPSPAPFWNTMPLI